MSVIANAASPVNVPRDAAVDVRRERGGFVVWLTGLSGAGKSTLAEALAPSLRARGLRVEVLDGDAVRTHLSNGLGFSRADRDTNVGRIAWVARLLAKHGVAVIVSAISPYREARENARRMVEEVAAGGFVEVHVAAPLEACVARDVKGLYKRALAGEIPAFTGVNDPYEPPNAPELALDTSREELATSLASITSTLERLGHIGGTS